MRIRYRTSRSGSIVRRGRLLKQVGSVTVLPFRDVHTGHEMLTGAPHKGGLFSTSLLSGFSKVTRDLMEYREFEERTRKLNRELRARVSELTEYQRQVELRTLNLSRGMAQPGRRKRPLTFKEIQGVLGPIESSCGGAL